MYIVQYIQYYIPKPQYRKQYPDLHYTATVLAREADLYMSNVIHVLNVFSTKLKKYNVLEEIIKYSKKYARILRE